MKDKLKNIFQNSYPGIDIFISDVLIPIFSEDFIEKKNVNLIVSEEIKKRADNANIQSAYHVADIDRIDSDPIAVYDVTLKPNSKITHSRVAIKQFITALSMTYTHIFIVFHYENEPERPWRFSYVYKEGTTAGTRATAKRYTYVFGKDYHCRTAIDRFVELANSHKTDADFAKAFSVEALGDEFFDNYKKLYIKFVKFISGKVYEKKNGKWQDVVYHEPQSFYTTSFEGNDKQVRDYVKKLFGRIVFLYFLQRKGWLAQNKQYMHDLYYNSEHKDNFLDEVLEPLFFGVLNTPFKNRNEKAKTLPFYEQIPYLNGGLFQNDELDDRECKFPSLYFEELFAFFDQYNFTIDENDQEDAEVGIDPEMLGRIFENLLEDNKDKGAYYTPKEIVDYMCRESIISYLQDDGFSSEGNLLIRQFIETLDPDSLTEEQKLFLKKKLINVKICDPAIGSGAFPMGMVNLISKIYLALGLVKDRSKMKRHIMEQSIYGVDIEKGAVDIARLRFWLAMVVEDDAVNLSEVTPLPNLNYKIMQGNSLIENFAGIDLSNLISQNKNEFEYVYDEKFQKILEEKLTSFYKSSEHANRESLTNEINNLITSRLKELRGDFPIENIKPSENSQYFMWHTWFSDVFKSGGFDIVIGNPPYGAKLSDEDKKLLKSLYYTTKTIANIQKGSMDTYTMFIELSYKLLKKNGSFAMIVPISLTSSDSLSGIHRILYLRCDDIRISSYAVRPQPVFKNAVVNTSILLFRKTGSKCSSLKSTKMYRKGKNFNLQYLIDNLEYIDVLGYTMFGRIPKISYEIEKNILNKLYRQKRLGLLMRSSGSPIVYRFAGGRYFKVVTNYSNGSSAERTIYFDEEIANSIGCILSSSLSFWFYQIYSDNLNWKNYELSEFRIPELSLENIKILNDLYSRYLQDIEINANVRVTSGSSSYNVSNFKEYKIGKSKNIIDEIDDYIAPLYGLTQDEIEFIKNYEIEFRLTDDD